VSITLWHATADAVPPDDDWLTPRERVVLDGLRFEKRRTDWRLGRWTAKHAVAARLGTDVTAVAIVADDEGAPVACAPAGAPLPVAVSITHREEIAVCAVTGAGVAIGCDLELVEDRPSVFAGDWFTDAELARVERAPVEQRAHVTTLTWAAKEAAMKARRDGLRLPTRAVEVRDVGTAAGAHGWCPLLVHVDAPPDETLRGWWRDEHHERHGAALRFVLAVTARPPAPAPEAGTAD
jgi:4'-phosphopantetheinyl transferase